MTQKNTHTPYIPEKFLLLHVLLYNIDNILNRIKKERATKCSPFLFYFLTILFIIPLHTLWRRFLYHRLPTPEHPLRLFSQRLVSH